MTRNHDRRKRQLVTEPLLDPAEPPTLRVIGIADGESQPSETYDVAREHDRYLADVEEARRRSAQSFRLKSSQAQRHLSWRRRRP